VSSISDARAMRRVIVFLGTLIAVVMVLAACGGEESVVSDSGEPRLELVGAGANVEVKIEVADTSAERRRGLSGRDLLPADQGMLFVNDQDVTIGFQMADTAIPLSLAFISGAGEILHIVDMDPCVSESCEVYESPLAYRRALEVNQGAFAQWGIGVGDRVVLSK
jgi:uncharacterized membrane protein (UPF0127 family)